MSEKVVHFPSPKRMKAKVVLETDFQYLMDKLVKISIGHGRGQGFLIGVTLANLFHVFTEVILKHWL